MKSRSSIRVPTLVIHRRGDRFFPVSHGRFLADNITDARYVEIDSPHGHDAFLIEDDQVGAALHDFLIDVEKSA